MNGHERVNREIIILSNLNKVVLCLEKIKSKNLGQNSDNLKHFLLKDFHCDCEDAIKLIGETLAASIIKPVIFIDKVAYIIVRSDTILVPETEESDGNNEHANSVILEESLISQLESSTPPEHQRIDDDNISTIIENKVCSYFESTEKRFMKIEDYLTGISSSKSTTEHGNVHDNFYKDMLKNRILELEKQLCEKNAIIDFLTLQFITKPLDTSTNKSISDNNNHQLTNGNNKSNHHDTP